MSNFRDPNRHQSHTEKMTRAYGSLPLVRKQERKFHLDSSNKRPPGISHIHL